MAKGTEEFEYSANLLRTIAFVAGSDFVSTTELGKFQRDMPLEGWDGERNANPIGPSGFYKPNRYLSWAEVKGPDVRIIGANELLEMLLTARSRDREKAQIIATARGLFAGGNLGVTLLGEFEVPVVTLGVRLSRVTDRRVIAGRCAALELLQKPTEQARLATHGLEPSEGLISGPRCMLDARP